MNDNQLPLDTALAGAITELVTIMAALRHPKTGCPWDIEQSFASIAHYTIEEAYEVFDAIEKNDHFELKNELGDLLFQVVFHARIAEEAGLFDFKDVVSAISQKMIERHPHVFAVDALARSAQVQTLKWEEHKAAERRAKAPSPGAVGALDGVAQALPALMRAQKLQKRAARTGFDWPSVPDAAEKIDEELSELLEANLACDAKSIEEEAGDLLFSCVNVIRKLGVDAEAALRCANQKFTRRFETMEDFAKDDDKDFSALSLNEQDALWKRVKSQETH